jgi:hydroxyacyl-ACP dehydratase HTD2-like protein with hotdog domain
MRLRNVMIQKYTILLEKYLKDELSFEAKLHFEQTIARNIRISEILKEAGIIPEHQFVKLYHAIKQKVDYRMKQAV